MVIFLINSWIFNYFLISSLSLSLYFCREKGVGEGRADNFEAELEKVWRRGQAKTRSSGIETSFREIPVMHASLSRPFLFWPLDSCLPPPWSKRNYQNLRLLASGRVEASNDIACSLSGIMSIRIGIKERSGFWGIWVNQESRMNGPADSIFQSQSFRW